MHPPGQSAPRTPDRPQGSSSPTNAANSLNSRQKRSGNTVKSYMDHLEDAYLFREYRRFDVKGKDYFEFPSKYYCEDLGLRNVLIGFRQQEMTHTMENIIYNELIICSCAVDILVSYSSEKDNKGRLVQIAREIDFVAVLGEKKTYIQSTFVLLDEKKAERENKPFLLTGDSFPKIIVRHDIRKRWYDDKGILNIGIIDFLLDDSVV